MSDPVNRRQSERRPLSEKLFGYLDGQRYDLSSANISAGGLFLRFDEPERIAKGTRLALAFRRETALRDRVFLVAHVVRHQAEPAGLGLAWVKAVAVGEPADLARFLEQLLGLAFADVLSAIRTEASGRIAYRFTSPTGTTAAVLPAADTARGMVDAMPAFEPPPPPPDAMDEPTPGPITQQITVDAVRAPSSLPAAVRTLSKTVQGTIVALGARSLVLEVSSLLTGPFDRIDVGFEIPADGRMFPITAVARLTAIEPLTRPGVLALDLALDSLDEGAMPGLVRRYVRWLHQRAVTAS